MRLMAMAHIGEITNVYEGESEITVSCGTNFTMFYENKDVEIKVGDNKVKVSMLDFMQSFKDMLDTGEFYMDQIDESVWEIEKQNEDLTGRLDYLNAAMREIKGGY